MINDPGNEKPMNIEEVETVQANSGGRHMTQLTPQQMASNDSQAQEKQTQLGHNQNWDETQTSQGSALSPAPEAVDMKDIGCSADFTTSVQNNDSVSVRISQPTTRWKKDSSLPCGGPKTCVSFAAISSTFCSGC